VGLLDAALLRTGFLSTSAPTTRGATSRWSPSPSIGGVSRLALVGQNVQCLPLVGISLLVWAFRAVVRRYNRSRPERSAFGDRGGPPQPDGGTAGGRADGGGESFGARQPTIRGQTASRPRRERG